MSDRSVPPTEITSDDKLWAALAYVFSPIFPVIILLMEDKKNRPFIKAHNVQALILAIVLYIIVAMISIVTFGLGSCLGVLPFILLMYYGYTAYQGKYIHIPIITDFVRKQGWG